MGEPTCALFDDGAQVSLVSEAVVQKLGLQCETVDVTLGWFTKGHVQVTKCVKNLPVIIGGHKFVVPSLLVVPLASYDIILGVRWREHVNMDARYRRGRRQFVVTTSQGTRVTLTPAKHKPRSTLHAENISICNVAQAEKLLAMKGTTALALMVSPAKEALKGEEEESLEGTKLSMREQMEKAISPDCPAHLRVKLLSLLHKFESVFKDPQGVPKAIPSYIKLQLAPGAVPFASSPYKLSAEEVEALAKILDDFMRRGWIEKAVSEWASPILLLRKKSGGWRLVVDFRQVNQRTVSDQFPLPRIDSLLERLNGMQWFSAMDLAQGYHQLGLPEESSNMTTFTTPLGLFRYRVVPMGLKQAPAWFSRRMQEVFRPVVTAGDLSTYLDDLLAHTLTPEQHLLALEKVFTLMRDADLHVSLTKCIFMARQVGFLGHEVSGHGVQPDKSKVQALLDWPSFALGQVVDTAQLWKFYGLVNWFRRFIPRFSTIAAPLTELLANKGDTVWQSEHQEAFDALKGVLVHDVTLTCFDPSLETCIWVDASEVGLGGFFYKGAGRGGGGRWHLKAGN